MLNQIIVSLTTQKSPPITKRRHRFKHDSMMQHHWI